MKKVLIIEDEHELRNSVQEMLFYENFQTATAENGQRGVEVAEEVKPDIILCDILMPDMNGFQVLEKLNSKKSFSGIPFIFLTALNERADFRHGMELGADDYLTKPFSRDELLNAISSRIRKVSEQEAYLEMRIAEIEKEVNNRLGGIQNELDEKKKSLSKVSSEKEQIGYKLQAKEMELMLEALRTIETNNKIQELKLIIEKESQSVKLTGKIKMLFDELKNKINEKKILLNSLTIFQLRFNRVYPNFVTNISSRFSFLTQYEIAFVSAHLMGLSTSQIADLLNISDGSVRKSRYRLKKKMGLNKDENFVSFIQCFNEQSDN